MPSKTEHPSCPAEVTEHSRGPGRGGGGGEEGVRVGVGTLFQLTLSHCPVCVRASCFSLWAMGIWGDGEGGPCFSQLPPRHLAQHQALSGSSGHTC